VAYTPFPIETDPTALFEEAAAWLQGRPGWEDWVPRSANFDAGTLEAHARIAAEVRDIASTHPDEIFERLGQLSGIRRTLAASASVSATVAALDTQGYTLPAGTVVAIRATGDRAERFAVADDVTIPIGSLSAGGVTLIAEQEGAAGNDLGGADLPADVIDRTLPWAAVTLTGTTAGGADEESIADYLDKVEEELTLSAPRPILPRDFALFARRVPGVYRALAVDLYTPPAPYGPGAATGVARAVTVFVVDEAGLDPGDAVRTAVLTDLQARRESTFLVYVSPAGYVTVDVEYSGAVESGFSPAEVLPRANAALQEYLSPATAGLPARSLGRDWVSVDRIRRTELYAVLNAVDGLDYVDDTLTINGAATDLVLIGPAVLPQPGAIDGDLR
jgi:Baseplate J-like protein